MGNKPLVSIIIPVYNVQPYLSEALESVIHQTYRNLEIIIIDDGSTDESGKICDDFAAQDNRIRVIHQNNRGLSAARNIGLDMMTGEMVAFLDPDDAFHPEFTEKMLTAMLQNQADMVLCKYTSHKTTGRMQRRDTDLKRPLIQSGIYDRISMLHALLYGDVNYSVWNKLYRRTLWNHIRFLEGHVFEDWEPTYRVFNLSKKTVVLDTPLYLYRKRSESITATSSWKHLCDRLLSASRVKNFFTEISGNGITEDMLQRIRQIYFNALISTYAKIDQVKDIADKKAEKKKAKAADYRQGKEEWFERLFSQNQAGLYHDSFLSPYFHGILSYLSPHQVVRYESYRKIEGYNGRKKKQAQCGNFPSVQDLPAFCRPACKAVGDPISWE